MNSKIFKRQLFRRFFLILFVICVYCGKYIAVLGHCFVFCLYVALFGFICSLVYYTVGINYTCTHSSRSTQLMHTLILLLKMLNHIISCYVLSHLSAVHELCQFWYG